MAAQPVLVDPSDESWTMPAIESSVASWRPEPDPGWAAEWGPQAEPGKLGGRLADRASPFGRRRGSPLPPRRVGAATFRCRCREPSVAVAGEPTRGAGDVPLSVRPATRSRPNVPVSTPTGWAASPSYSARTRPVDRAGPAVPRICLRPWRPPQPCRSRPPRPCQSSRPTPCPSQLRPPDGRQLRVPPARSAHLGPYGVGPTILVALLALASRGAFLPAWDHYVGVVAASGRSISFSLGNAFSGPWPIVLGNVITALALLAIPIAVTRLRDRTIAAAVVVGSLIVLAAQFTSAIVQVDQTVPPSVVGLTPAQQTQLGLQLHLSLTGWFTFDVLAAYALFVAVMVIGYLRPVEAPGQRRRRLADAPEDTRSPAGVPWS